MLFAHFDSFVPWSFFVGRARFLWHFPKAKIYEEHYVVCTFWFFCALKFFCLEELKRFFST
jgi:hypothetical protein